MSGERKLFQFLLRKFFLTLSTNKLFEKSFFFFNLHPTLGNKNRPKFILVCRLLGFKYFKLIGASLYKKLLFANYPVNFKGNVFLGFFKIDNESLRNFNSLKQSLSKLGFKINTYGILKQNLYYTNQNLLDFGQVKYLFLKRQSIFFFLPFLKFLFLTNQNLLFLLRTKKIYFSS